MSQIYIVIGSYFLTAPQVLLQEKVHDPEKAAKRKLQVKEKKKQSKKMKLEMLHGKRPRPKKRKAEDIDVEDQLLKDDDE